jgi:hypothetical protein
MLKHLVDKIREFNKETHVTFVHYEEAFDKEN